MELFCQVNLNRVVNVYVNITDGEIRPVVAGWVLFPGFGSVLTWTLAMDTGLGVVLMGLLCGFLKVGIALRSFSGGG